MIVIRPHSCQGLLGITQTGEGQLYLARVGTVEERKEEDRWKHQRREKSNVIRGKKWKYGEVQERQKAFFKGWEKRK